MYNFTDLNKVAATPGIGSIIYLAPLKWIAAIGGFNTANSSEPGASVVIDEAHTMIAGKGFLKFYSTQEVSEFMGQSAGEPDSETMEFDLTLQQPGVTPKQAEFIRNAKGEDWIAIIKSANCADDVPIQLGTDCARLRLTFEVMSGQINTGTKGMKVTGKWYHPYPIFYSAAIPLLPGQDEGGGEGE